MAFSLDRCPRIHEKKIRKFRTDTFETRNKVWVHVTRKRPRTCRSHELHESKLPFVSRIEYIRSKRSILYPGSVRAATQCRYANTFTVGHSNANRKLCLRLLPNPPGPDALWDRRQPCGLYVMSIPLHANLLQGQSNTRMRINAQWFAWSDWLPGVLEDSTNCSEPAPATQVGLHINFVWLSGWGMLKCTIHQLFVSWQWSKYSESDIWISMIFRRRDNARYTWYCARELIGL